MRSDDTTENRRPGHNVYLWSRIHPAADRGGGRWAAAIPLNKRRKR
jgi:hypothetical protein